MKITDYTYITSAKPVYPDMMSENAELELINLFNLIRDKKEELASLRTKAILLDQDLKPLLDKYNELSKMFNIEYSTKEIQEIHEECGLGIFNREDARNK